MIIRRTLLASVSAAFASLFAPRGKPCDIVVSDRHGVNDCPRRAAFAYADPTVNRHDGPRHFCGEHTGCATLPIVELATGRYSSQKSPWRA